MWLIYETLKVVLWANYVIYIDSYTKLLSLLLSVKSLKYIIFWFPSMGYSSKSLGNDAVFVLFILFFAIVQFLFVHDCCSSSLKYIVVKKWSSMINLNNEQLHTSILSARICSDQCCYISGDNLKRLDYLGDTTWLHGLTRASHGSAPAMGYFYDRLGFLGRLLLLVRVVRFSFVLAIFSSATLLLSETVFFFPNFLSYCPSAQRTKVVTPVH